MPVEVIENLADRRVVVTGAARGIGERLAAKLLEQHARVASFDIMPVQHPEHADCFRHFHCDLTSDDSVAEAVGQAENWLGHIDAAVHCAGVGRYAPFLDLSERDWTAMLDVNLLGAVRLARHALPGMLRRENGQLIVIGSRRGREPAPETSAYSASKAAVQAFLSGLGLEVNRFGVHTCLIMPGGVRTDFGGVAAADKDDRFLDPSTIADMAVYFLRHPNNAWIREVTVLPLGL